MKIIRDNGSIVPLPLPPNMKSNHILTLAVGTMLTAAVSVFSSASAQPLPALNEPAFDGVVATHDSSLNDLLRRLPAYSRMRERELAALSAIQERMLVHERRMRGEGLPEVFRTQFSRNYTDIVSAIVDDRITMRYGRELLDVHRQLLDRAWTWNGRPARDAEYGKVIGLALDELRDELAGNAEPQAVVPECVRTPVVKGHQLWIEELVQSGATCHTLHLGEIGALRLMAHRIERFEGYYKRDGHLTLYERENLHERLIDLNRELIDALSR